MTNKKLNIGFDTTDKTNRLQQSVCSMLSGASKRRRKINSSVSKYIRTNGYG